jgi:uncharacterized membrane protein
MNAFLTLISFCGASATTHNGFFPYTTPGSAGCLSKAFTAMAKTLLAAVLLMLAPSIARGERTTLTNNTNGTVKVCVYNANDRSMVIPRKCWTIKPKNEAQWDRNESPSVAFHIKVFERGIIDRLVCSRINLKTTNVTIVSRHSSVNVKWTPYQPVSKSRQGEIRFCNRSASRPIWVALSFYDRRDQRTAGWTSQGWWQVEPDNCTTAWSGPLPNYVYVYGTTQGIIKKVWEGKDASFCINHKTAFEIKQSDLGSCRGFDRERVRMAKFVLMPGTNDWTF